MVVGHQSKERLIIGNDAVFVQPLRLSPGLKTESTKVWHGPDGLVVQSFFRGLL